MVKKDDKTARIRKKVEQMGVYFEKSGLTPMHGRVFAYLLLAEPPYKDFYDIQDFLKASKSAISNALKFLQSEGLVDYRTFSGDRRKYFQVNMEGWLKSSAIRIRQAETLKDLVVGVLEEREDSNYREFNKQLKNMIDFHTELAAVLERFMDSWEKKHSK